MATDKLLFIHPDTHITGVGDDVGIDKAIRVAITIDNNSPIILANCDDQYDGRRSTTAAAANADGEDVYVNYNPDNTTNEYNSLVTATQNAYGLLYWHGGRTSYDGDDDPTDDYEFDPDPQRVLYRLATDQICKVNIKIWLEGGDETCTDSIAGKVFDFMLKFDSVDVPVNTAA